MPGVITSSTIDQVVNELDAMRGNESEIVPRAMLLVCNDELSSCVAMQELRAWTIRISALTCEAQCNSVLCAPYAPFRDIVDQLAKWAAEYDPLLLNRYGSLITTLLPYWSCDERLSNRAPIRSALAALCFRNIRHGIHEFYQGRDYSPRIVEEIARFVLDVAGAAHGLILLCQNMEASSKQGRRIFKLLSRYGRNHPLVLIGVHRSNNGSADEFGTCEDIQPIHVHSNKSMVTPTEPELSNMNLPADAMQILKDLAAVRFPTINKEGIAALRPFMSNARIEESLQLLTAYGLVHITIDGRLAIASSDQQMLSECPSDHGHIINILDSRLDIFQRIYHAQIANSPRLPELLREAIELAWSASAYDSAIHYAEQLSRIDGGVKHVSPEIFLGLLHYEAHNYADTHKEFCKAYTPELTDAEKAYCNRLIGYNCIFGLRDFESGIKYMLAALKHYEQNGLIRDVAWTQNNLAFAFTSLGRYEEAVSLEESSLRLAEKLEFEDAFLKTILHLNLGRLHRRQSLAQAEQLFRDAISDSAGGLEPQLLLLLYATLASLYSAYDLPAHELAALKKCISIFLNLGVITTSSRVFPLLARHFVEKCGAFDDDAVLGGHQILSFMMYNLGRLYDKIGDAKRTDYYWGWLHKHLEALSAGAQLQRLAVARKEKRADGGGCYHTVVSKSKPSTGMDTDKYEDVLMWLDVDTWIDGVASRLVKGEMIAWTPSSTTNGIGESLLLFDPRNTRTRLRAMRDLGCPRTSGGVITLPEINTWFRGINAEFPYALQEGTILVSRRALAPAIPATRTLAMVLPPDDPLYPLVHKFAELTKIPFLSVLGFYPAGEEVTIDIRLVLGYYLQTSTDLLVTANRICEKRHGNMATENLSVLKPKVCGVLLPNTQHANCDGILACRGRSFRLGNQAYAVLGECKGMATVAELQRQFNLTDDLAILLRRLQPYNAVRFSL